MELPPEKLIVAQKFLIRRANDEAKLVFIESNILESMVQ